jgi:hypothetical protein
MICRDLPLPGRLGFRLGAARDYGELARFHYARCAPASFALTVAIDYFPTPLTRRVIGVGVLSYPSLSCNARSEALQLELVPACWRWAYLNRHLRTISRIIVHPQFRGIGLASAVVRFLLAQAPTRYTEAISRLGCHHPLFSKAGMQCLCHGTARTPAYYLIDRLEYAQMGHSSARSALTLWAEDGCSGEPFALVST